MTYRPTPNGLARDLRDVIHVLSIAIRNLNRAAVPQSSTEEVTAGSCYDADTKAKA